MNVKEWVQQVIKPAEIEKYLVNGKDFIDEKSIFGNLEKVVYNGTKEEFGQIESYDDEIRFIQCPIEYTGGTIDGASLSDDPAFTGDSGSDGTDSPHNGGSSDGEKRGSATSVIIAVIVILVLGGTVAFFVIKRNKQAKSQNKQ